MNILFSAGGTLGHINPALSFIKALKNYYKDALANKSYDGDPFFNLQKFL